MQIDFKKEYKSSIRSINLGGISIGGEESLPFMHSEMSNNLKPLTAVEILLNVPDNYPAVLRQAWSECIKDIAKWAKMAAQKGSDVLVIKFNLKDSNDIDCQINNCLDKLRQILEDTDIPLIILGSERKEIDIKLLPALIKVLNRQSTIGIITEDNYKEMIPILKDTDHNVIARTPIDINLAKQLNILITELGFDGNRIIIDPNTGALGYGLDYAYSIIERIRLAALEGDDMLNMPIISFVGEEAWKTKEAKSVNVQEEWGDINKRAIAWECLTASSLLAAGTDLVVMYHPDNVRYIKNFINRI